MRDVAGIALGLLGAGSASLPWTHGLLVDREPELPAEVLDVVEDPEPEPIVIPDWVHERPGDLYGGLRFDLEVQRRQLAEWSSEEDVRTAARGLLVSYLPHLMRGWSGTGYSYSGTSQEPGKGRIACGYFVSTVLQHAGFGVDRVDLARQPSEQIIRSLVPDEEITRFSRVSRQTVVDKVRADGPGVYIVGLDTHVGFLVHEGGEEVTFCHSTRRDWLGVVCEEAVTSPSLRSRYTVLGALGHEVMLDAWLAGDTIPTAHKHEAQELFASVEDSDVISPM